MRQSILFSLLLIILTACGGTGNPSAQAQSENRGRDGVFPVTEIADQYEGLAQAVFAGGCFWCTEASFERIQGVEEVISGYSGGDKVNPTYYEVANGETNHAESIIIFYDSTVVSYETLLEVFFVAHDPTQLNRQGPDVGRQYRSAIFYQSPAQKQKAEAYMKKLGQEGKFDKPIVTELNPYKSFYVAEAYHQDYYEHHPNDAYIRNVSRPKVEKVEKVFKDILKARYKA
jgi:peptide-methionine (S)-S-oxide reductase